MVISDYAERAAQYYINGYSCSESVAKAGLEALGIENDLIPKIATGFSGGMSKMKSICGAITGAVIVLGAKYGRSTPDQGREGIEGKVQTLVRGFQKEFGTDNCYSLTGLDFTQPVDDEKRAKAKKECQAYVRFCTQRVLELSELEIVDTVS